MRIRAAGGEAIHFVADVARTADVDQAVRSAADHFGRLDVLVNNAGITMPRTLTRTTDDEWHQTMDINAKSVFLTCRAVFAHLRAAGGGSIVNVSSANAIVGRPGLAAYSASASSFASGTPAFTPTA